MDSILRQGFCTDERVFHSSHAEEGRTTDCNKNDMLKIKVKKSQNRPITSPDVSRRSMLPDLKTIGA